jgi:hypothetical protein
LGPNLPDRLKPKPPPGPRNPQPKNNRSEIKRDLLVLPGSPRRTRRPNQASLQPHDTFPRTDQIASSPGSDSAEPFGPELTADGLVAGSQ